jgi:transposase
VTAVQEELPHATIIIDRFHVARHYRDCVDTLRKQEVKRLRTVLPEEQHDDLKHILWPSRKCPEDLEPPVQEQLKRFFIHSPALKQAMALREELTAIFDTARSKADGLRRIAFWRDRVVKSNLTFFDDFLRLLDNWLDLITNYFIDHESSGFVEGLNNKLKVLKRRCYGIRNVGRIFQRLTIDVEGYRRFSPWHATSH